jgi:hypothetical protein
MTGAGRADAHVAVDAAGELYIFTKTDGMIRAVKGQVARVGQVGRMGALWLR